MEKTYTSSSPAFVNGKLYRAGEPFTTEAKKGKDWTEVEPKKPKKKD